MENSGSLILFMIVSFALAIVVIFKKDSLPERIRRPLALFSLFMVAASFIMMVVSFFQMN